MGLEPSLRLARDALSQWSGALRQRIAEPDKRLHVQWSFWLTMTAHVLWPAAWAVAAVFVVGLAKECWDRRYGSGFCFIDMAFNVIGIAAGATLCAVLPKGVFS